MTDVKLDEIPELVKSKKLTIQEACVQIYYILYTNPARFALTDVDEDTRSDFLLYLLQYKFQTLLENFNPKVSPFGAYLYRTVRTSLLTFTRKITEKKNYSQVYIRDSICDYEQKLEDTQNSLLKIASPEPTFSPISTEKEIPQLVYKQVFAKRKYRMTLNDSHNRKIKRGLLILALKSAWYISDSQIQKVSKICDVSPKTLTDSVCKLKSKLINKALNRQTIEQNRNRAYCFIHNYRMKLQNTENDSIKNEYLQKKLDFQTRNWINKTNSLNSGKNKIAPTNSEIGEVIGLSSRFVSFYIRKLKELDITTIQQFL